MKIRLDAITFDAGTQIREALDQQVVSDYAEAMTAGEAFPPIVLFHDGSQHYLADGFHRFMAAQRNQFREIDAEVKPGTKEDALWFALGANRANGKRLNENDKKHAILLALQVWPERSANQIAEQIGCTHKYVSLVREQVCSTTNLPDRVTGKDGKSYPATRQQVERKPSPERLAVIERLQSGVIETAAETAAALNVHPNTVTEAKRAIGIPVRDKSKAAVQERRNQMRQMAAEGHSSRQIASRLGLSVEGCRTILKDEHIDVPADRSVGKAKLHDSNRIVEHMVMDAENLTADVNLIDFSDLDRARLLEWLKSLTASRDNLNGFIRRLMKEKQKNVKAA